MHIHNPRAIPNARPQLSCPHSALVYAGCSGRLEGGCQPACALLGSESAVRVGGEEHGFPTAPPGFPALYPPCGLPAFHRVLCTSIQHVFKAGELVHREHAGSASPVPIAFQGQPHTDTYCVQSSEPSSEPGQRGKPAFRRMDPIPAASSLSSSLGSDK